MRRRRRTTGEGAPATPGRDRVGTGRRARSRTGGALLLAAALAAAVACGPSPAADREGGDDAAAGTVSVMVTVPPLAWFVEAVGGDRVDVSVLVPPGASPAMYEPTVRQLRRLDATGLWVTVGHPRFPFEAAWREPLTAGRPELAVVGAGTDCPRGAGDPHLWTSPSCALRIVDRVAAALERRLPDAGDSLRARRERARAAVRSVDRDLRRWLAPHEGGAFLVFHPALGYLARDYGLEQMAIQRGATEPNPAELDRLVRRAREKGIRHVFVQPQFSRKAARTVAGALPGARVVTVDPLARDWPAGMRRVGRELRRALAARPSAR